MCPNRHQKLIYVEVHQIAYIHFQEWTDHLLSLGLGWRNQGGLKTVGEQKMAPVSRGANNSSRMSYIFPASNLIFHIASVLDLKGGTKKRGRGACKNISDWASNITSK